MTQFFTAEMLFAILNKIPDCFLRKKYQKLYPPLMVHASHIWNPYTEAISFLIIFFCYIKNLDN